VKFECKTRITARIAALQPFPLNIAVANVEFSRQNQGLIRIVERRILEKRNWSAPSLLLTYMCPCRTSGNVEDVDRIGAQKIFELPEQSRLV
jgi:hypothetical protein